MALGSKPPSGTSVLSYAVGSESIALSSVRALPTERQPIMMAQPHSGNFYDP